MNDRLRAGLALVRDRQRPVESRRMALDTGARLGPYEVPPRVLFDRQYAYGAGISIPNYDVGADGRFLMVKDEAGGGHLNLVLNWFTEARTRAAASR